MTVRSLSSKPLRLLILGSIGVWGCSTDHAPGNAGGAGAEAGGASTAGTDYGSGAAGATGNAGSGATTGSDGGEVGVGGGGAGSVGMGDGGNGAASMGDGGNGAVSTGDAGNAGNGGAGGDQGGCGAAGPVPSVLLMIDNSSSMFNPRESLWDPLFSVLMKPTDGIVAKFQSQVRFGFTSYRGTDLAHDPTCPVLFEVDYRLDNFEAINARYSAQNAAYSEGVKWGTPTGPAIAKVAQKLAATASDPPGPKNIVLVTDGGANTCATIDPQCGSDEAINAVQDAKLLGITTFVIGIGDLTNHPGCENVWGRCGVDFMQDMANAGMGLPVHAPPEALKYQACTPTNTLAASYATDPEVPGTAPYYAAANATELDAAFRQVLSSVLTCQ